MTQTVWLRGVHQRRLAHQLIDHAPVDAVVKVSAAKRSNDQNAKMWAMISDVSRQKPEGRLHVPEVWKAIFMAACGHEVQFENGLDNKPFPIGFRSSNLSKTQMADLIEYMYFYGSKHDIKWSEEHE
jgi:hypothetical protein